MRPDRRDPHHHATDQDQYPAKDLGDDRCRWGTMSSWMRNHAPHGEIEELDAGEDKQIRDYRDPQKHKDTESIKQRDLDRPPALGYNGSKDVPTPRCGSGNVRQGDKQGV